MMAWCCVEASIGQGSVSQDWMSHDFSRGVAAQALVSGGVAFQGRGVASLVFSLPRFPGGDVPVWIALNVSYCFKSCCARSRCLDSTRAVKR